MNEGFESLWLKVTKRLGYLSQQPMWRQQLAELQKVGKSKQR
jgi:hypothetical protein